MLSDIKVRSAKPKQKAYKRDIDAFFDFDQVMKRLESIAQDNTKTAEERALAKELLLAVRTVE